MIDVIIGDPDLIATEHISLNSSESSSVYVRLLIE